MRTLSILAASGLLALALPAAAQVDFTERTITHFATPAQMQNLSGTTTTNTLFVRSDKSETVHVIHSAAAADGFVENLLVYPKSDAAAGVDVADNATLMANAVTDDLRLDGLAVDGDVFAFTNGLAGSRQFLFGDATADPVSFAAVTDATTLLNGANGMAPVGGGRFVVVTASDFGSGNGDTLLVDTNAGTISVLFTAADLQAVTGGANNSIRGFDIADGTLWGFDNSTGSIVRIDDVLEPTRTFSIVSFPGVPANASIRNIQVLGDILVLADNLAVDRQFRIYDISNPAAPALLESFSYQEITDAIPDTFFAEPQFHNGMALTQSSATTMEMFIAARNSTGLGIIKVQFGTPAANVGDWQRY